MSAKIAVYAFGTYRREFLNVLQNIIGSYWFLIFGILIIRAFIDSNAIPTIDHEQKATHFHN